MNSSVIISEAVRRVQEYEMATFSKPDYIIVGKAVHDIFKHHAEEVMIGSSLVPMKATRFMDCKILVDEEADPLYIGVGGDQGEF